MLQTPLADPADDDVDLIDLGEAVLSTLGGGWGLPEGTASVNSLSE